jgi:hypothetical protein
MNATKTVTVDREALKQFIVEVDAIATVEMIRAGGTETPLVEHMYRLIEDFEVHAFGYRLAADDHDHPLARGRELFRELHKGAYA